MSFPLWKAYLHNWDPLSVPIPPPPPALSPVDDEEEISMKTEKDEEMSTEEPNENDDVDPLLPKKENSTIEKRLEIVIDTFEIIQTKYKQEYKHFDLSSLAILISFPLWKAYLHNWDPLSLPLKQKQQQSIIKKEQQQNEEDPFIKLKKKKMGCRNGR